MEQKAASLLATLKRSSAPADAKLAQLNDVKKEIKHNRVPEASQSTIFEALRIAIAQQTSTTLVASGFSTLAHYIKRLALQEGAAAIASHGPKLFPAIVERLGDARESHRAAAAQAFSDLWPFCAQEVEHIMRDEAMTGNNARAKEASLQWVMSKDEGMQFKSFVPHMVVCLEDSDGAVRDAARTAVVELFRKLPDRAKADLQRQLNSHSVRKSIVAQITSQLGLSSMADQALSASTLSAPSFDQSHNAMGDSVMSEAAVAPPMEAEPMDPIYVHTQRELDDMLRDMLPPFEGKESEGNWMARDKNVYKLRRLTKGNAPTEFHVSFVAGLKTLLEGILKVAKSLRTTMSTNGCQLVQELAQTLGPALDPITEILLQDFVKVCAATKHIAAQNGHATVNIIFGNVTYTSRVMQHIWLACQDKNVQPRTFAAEWLRTVIRRQSQHKAHFEHTGGLEIAEKCIKKGLSDAQPKVREEMRATYWMLAQEWPEKGETIMSTLDVKSKDLLEKDSHNPNRPSLASSQSSSKDAVFKPNASTNSRPSLKEMLAQKKAAARKLPERPSSAMATLSPSKPAIPPSHSKPPSTLSKTVATRPTSSKSSASVARSADSTSSSSTLGKGSLMSAPMRRPRRAEIARPATADPYASRRMQRPDTPSAKSPPNNSPKDVVTKSSTSTTSALRSRTARTQSPQASPVKSKPEEQVLGARQPTVELNAGVGDVPSPTREEDDLTMIMPLTKSTSGREPNGLPFRRRPGFDKTMSVDSGIPSIAEDDGFTMVIPHMPALQRRQSPLADRAPARASSVPYDGDTLSTTANRVHISPRRHNSSLVPVFENVSQRQSMSNSASTNGRAVEEMKVYEDPFTATDQEVVRTPKSEKTILEELFLDQNSRVRSPSNGSVSNNSSPRSGDGANGSGPTVQDKAETLRSCRMLASGINCINARNLDAHGFRRVQELVKSNQDIWSDGERFGELLLALLDYLEAPNDTLKTTPLKAQNLKTQVLSTIRAMLVLHRKGAAPYYSRALCTVLATRKQYDSTSHITSDLEKTAAEIVRYGQPDECLNAALGLVETSPSSSSSSPDAAHNTRTTTFSLSVMTSLLQQSTNPRPLVLTAQHKQRLSALAVRFMNNVDPDVRKANMEFCIELYERLGREKGEFWKCLGGPNGVGEGGLNLLSYYIARRSRA
ncbi:hypothetical protein B0A49_02679 [Cryomyces minteri]|uniref:TOG domain-containing protein n=1 Tax=Cryomyces minteri TaxID=331657 RepID=A0A4U0XV93_9PEZI|nr:hypothetical protein B0A49_02679 [Cryomyces minteri]